MLVGHLVGELDRVTSRGDGVFLVGAGAEDAVADLEVVDIGADLDDLADHGVSVFEGAIGEADAAVEPFAVHVDGDVAVDADLGASADGGDVCTDEQAVGWARRDVDVVEARLFGSGDDQSFQWMPPLRSG